ncbi:hypothetical protein GCM10009554_08650 [Kribbella koreensis]
MHTAVIETRTLAAQPTVVRRATLPPSEVTGWLPLALGDIAEWLRHRRIVPCGFPFSRRHQAADGLVVVEAGFPVTLPVAPNGLALPSELPAGPVVVTAYSGPYRKIGTAYDLIEDWLRRHHDRATGDAWEIYHSPPIGCPDEWHPEIVQPYSIA